MSLLFEDIEVARLLNIPLRWRAMSSSILVSCERIEADMACHVISIWESSDVWKSSLPPLAWRAMSSH